MYACNFSHKFLKRISKTIMTRGVKLRFKSASFSIDFYIAEFVCSKQTNIVAAVGGRKKMDSVDAGCVFGLNKLPVLYNFHSGRGLVWNQLEISFVFQLI